MVNNDISGIIEAFIKAVLNEKLRVWGADAGTFNEVMGDYRTGSGVAVKFGDGSQYKITIEQVK